MTKLKTIVASTLLASVFAAGTAMAENYTVTAMLLKFDPLVVKIAPGDTVYWENMATHNVHMMDGLIPEGTEAFVSELGKNISHTFEKEGVYIYQCDPHIGNGMGGAVIVGEPTNLDAIKSQDVSGGLGQVVDDVIPVAESM